jgi:hypothetical protein
MKKVFFCILMASVAFIARSQQIYIETGMVASAFDYKNSEGNRLSNLKGSFRNTLGLGVRMPVMKSWNVSLGISNNKYGASGNDPVLGNYSEWDVSYLGVNLGADHEFFKPEMYNIEREGFSFCLKGGLSADFLLGGKQKLNSMVFDLSGEEEFDKPAFFANGGVRGNWYITRSYIAYVQYMFGRSFFFGAEGQEQLRYTTHTISLGFAVDLIYKRE